MDEFQSTIIKAIRFPLIVLVIFVHVSPHMGLAVNHFENGMDFYNFFSEMISHNLGGIAVPCFFFLSGYLFFFKLNKFDANIYISQLKKRINTLFIPYILWNVICLLAELLHTYYKELNNFELNWYQIFWGGPANFPLWYLRDLICLSILSPLFYIWFKYLRMYGILLFVFLYLLWGDLSLFPGLGITSCFFFGIGAFCGIYKKNILEFCLHYKKLCYTLFVPMLFLSTYFNGEWFHGYFIRPLCIVGCITLFCLMCQVANKYKKVTGYLCFLAQTTFFVYCIHLIQIEGFFKGLLLRTMLSDSPIGMSIWFCLVPLCTLTVCLFLFFILKKKCPSILNILCGRR